MIALNTPVRAAGLPGTVAARHGLADGRLTYLVRHDDGRVRSYLAAAVRVAVRPGVVVPMPVRLRLVVDNGRTGA